MSLSKKRRTVEVSCVSRTWAIRFPCVLDASQKVASSFDGSISIRCSYGETFRQGLPVVIKAVWNMGCPKLEWGGWMAGLLMRL